MGIATIRPCLASDAGAIDALFHEFLGYLRSIGDEHVYSFGARQYLSDGFGPDPAFRGFVAETGEPIGYVLFSRTYDSEYVRGLHLVDLYVRQDSRGQGVGLLLMNAVRDVAAREGATRLSWDVHRLNAGALRFYERLGARYVTDAHTMYLDLAQLQTPDLKVGPTTPPAPDLKVGPTTPPAPDLKVGPTIGPAR